jgi:hypothetical protein
MAPRNLSFPNTSSVFLPPLLALAGQQREQMNMRTTAPFASHFLIRHDDWSGRPLDPKPISYCSRLGFWKAALSLVPQEGVLPVASTRSRIRIWLELWIAARLMPFW